MAFLMWQRTAFALLFAWLLAYEVRVLVAPELDIAPLSSRFAHDVVLVAASALCLHAAWRMRGERLPWLLIALGVVSWTLGEVYFTAILWDLDEVPIPSPADVGYLGYVVLALVGLAVLLGRRARHTPQTLWTDGLIAALAFCSVNAAVVLEPVLEHLPDRPVAIAVNLAYGIGDILLMGVLVGALASTGWRADRRWVLLATGVAVFWLADSLYLVATAQGTYVSGYTWYEAGWWTGLTCIALAAHQRWDRPVEIAEPEGLRFIAMPLAFGSLGLGVLIYGCLAEVNALAIVLAALSLVAVMGRLVLTFRENTRMLRASRVEAETDVLTGLGNRRALARELEARLPAATELRPLVLVLFDLDGFKHYNDVFGHPAGDALLARLGANLARYLSGRGVAFRMGGDEFCALFEPGTDVAEPIIAGAASALSEHGEGFHITCSRGAIVLPREAEDVTEALRIADQRLYAHKHGGRMSAGRQSAEVLLRALAERHPELHAHLEEVAGLAAATAERLGLPGEEVERVRHAAELHDVGKVAIPDAILAKRGPLEPGEWEFVRRHPALGERIIAAAPALGHLAELVRWSHERWDGAGYPDGLAGSQIPIGARIVAVADAFHAMTSARPYSVSVTAAAAVAELRRCAGSQFDPVVVEAFCAAWAARLPVAA